MESCTAWNDRELIMIGAIIIVTALVGACLLIAVEHSKEQSNQTTTNMKIKPFKKSHVEVCRNCRGEGWVMPTEGSDIHTRTKCPVCKGSGKMRKTTEGTVTVEPIP